MSIIRADSIKNRAGTGAPDFPNGITVTGIVTSTVLDASVTNLTVSGNLGVGGTITYEDVTNVDSVGVITARAGINLVGNDLNVGSNIKIGNASGIVTATTFSGSAASLTNVPAANLTGALPAISGANLTGIDASQIVKWTYHNTATGYSRSNTSSWQNFTDWRVNITPTSTSNRIMLIASTHLESRFSSNGGSGTVMQWQVSTDGGSSYVDIDNGNVGGRGWSNLNNARVGSLCTLVSIDIPNNTNLHQYRMRGRTGGYSNTESWFGNSCDASWWGSGSGNTNSWFYAIEFKPNA